MRAGIRTRQRPEGASHKRRDGAARPPRKSQRTTTWGGMRAGGRREGCGEIRRARAGRGERARVRTFLPRQFELAPRQRRRARERSKKNGERKVRAVREAGLVSARVGRGRAQEGDSDVCKICQPLSKSKKSPGELECQLPLIPAGRRRTPPFFSRPRMLFSCLCELCGALRAARVRLPPHCRTTAAPFPQNSIEASARRRCNSTLRVAEGDAPAAPRCAARCCSKAVGALLLPPLSPRPRLALSCCSLRAGAWRPPWPRSLRRWLWDLCSWAWRAPSLAAARPASCVSPAAPWTRRCRCAMPPGSARHRPWRKPAPRPSALEGVLG